MATTSSTSSITPSTAGSNVLRITGMASGLDVDSTVKALMTAEQYKIDKANQDQQTLQWKQSAYQDIIKDVKDMQNSFFDVSSSDTNILSSSNYSALDATSVDSVSSTATPSATATAGAGATAGVYVVSNVTLATQATKNSSITNVSQADTSITGADFTGGHKLNIKINGTNQVISLASNDATLADVVSDINTKINANGSLTGKIVAQVSPDGTKVQFSAKTTDSFNISNGTGDTTLSKLGYTATSFDIDQSVNDSVSNLFGGNTAALCKAAFSIQSGTGTAVSFNYDFSATGAQKGWTIDKVLSDISSKAGVKASYNQLSRTFSLTSAGTGSDQSVNVTADANGFMSKIFGTTSGTAFSGTDAVATIKNPQGVTATVVKPTNNFTIDSVNYNLVSNDTTSNTNITLTSNVQKTYDKVTGFITKYNALVTKINTKLTEKKDPAYPPLTDAQKASMSADQITAWNAKAQVGLLRNDINLQKMLSDLTQAFSTPVSGVSLAITKYGSSACGLDTSTDTSNPGMISITDTTLLKNTIAKNPDQFLKLFTNVSTSTDATTKNSESGIFTRINTIFQNNVGITGTSFNTSILSQYANSQDSFSSQGYTGKNTLPDQIYAKTVLIKNLQSEFSTKQTALYNKFSVLETAMNKLNSQQASLTSMLG